VCGSLSGVAKCHPVFFGSEMAKQKPHSDMSNSFTRDESRQTGLPIFLKNRGEDSSDKQCDKCYKSLDIINQVFYLYIISLLEGVDPL